MSLSSLSLGHWPVAHCFDVAYFPSGWGSTQTSGVATFTYKGTLNGGDMFAFFQLSAMCRGNVILVG